MSQTPPQAAPELSRREILTVFVGLMAGMSLASLDGTAVNTAIATMVADLGGLSAYAWIGTAYLLTSTVSNALFGKLSDIYGRRPLFQAAIITFIIGSIGCAVAQSMSVLVISRGVQGVTDDGDLRAQLSPILDGEEIDALESRLKVLAATGCFPEPSPDWPPLPWPLV